MTMQYQKLFEPAALGAASATIATATALLRGAVVRLTNTSAAMVPVTLYAIPAAGAAGVTNQFFPAKSVPANDYIDVAVPQMKVGDILAGFAGTAAVVNIQAIAGAYYSA